MPSLKRSISKQSQAVDSISKQSQAVGRYPWTSNCRERGVKKQKNVPKLFGKSRQGLRYCDHRQLPRWKQFTQLISERTSRLTKELVFGYIHTEVKGRDNAMQKPVQSGLFLCVPSKTVRISHHELTKEVKPRFIWSILTKRIV